MKTPYVLVFLTFAACGESVGVGTGGSFADFNITQEETSFFNALESVASETVDLFDGSTEASCDGGGSIKLKPKGQGTVEYTFDKCATSFATPKCQTNGNVITCEPANEVLSGTETLRLYTNEDGTSGGEIRSRVSGSGTIGYLMECDIISTIANQEETITGECKFTDSAGTKITIPGNELEP